VSIQGDIEDALWAKVSGAIAGLVRIDGPGSGPRAEGSERVAAIRKTAGTGTRLEFGQTLWSESFGMTLAWQVKHARETCATEWEAFRAALVADPDLALVATIPTLEQAWLSAELWGEAADAHFRTMTATVTVERVE
jgi:hypothetical protein